MCGVASAACVYTCVVVARCGMYACITPLVRLAMSLVGKKRRRRQWLMDPAVRRLVYREALALIGGRLVRTAPTFSGIVQPGRRRGSVRSWMVSSRARAAAFKNRMASLKREWWYQNGPVASRTRSCLFAQERWATESFLSSQCLVMCSSVSAAGPSLYEHYSYPKAVVEEENACDVCICFSY